MSDRKASINRATSETRIGVELVLDGKGSLTTTGGIGFFNHILGAMAKYALFDIKLSQEGDLDVDQHHLVEDIGICLGQALKDALGDKTGLRRFGWSLVPMDDALVDQ